MVGPTASGKTDFAIRLAQKYETEIISADARQVYAELNIGTAKPSQPQLNQFKHHFIGSHSIHQVFDAGSFEVEALKVIRSLFEQNDTVVMVGGSGLFVRAVCEGFDDIVPIPEWIRASVIADYQQKGLLFLQEELQSKDPLYFEQVDTQNPMRVMRAVEVLRASGQPFSSFRSQKPAQREFAIHKIGIDWPREQLYERINRRVEAMLEMGLEEEARSLWPLKGLIPLKTVGYTEFFDFFEGLTSRQACIELIKRNTRRYAKRQLTWFRKDANTRWLKPQEMDAFLQDDSFSLKKQ